MNDLVSVIIPLYNRQNTIVRAVESVLNQTYKNIEIIIVDDCSSDDGCKIIENKYKHNDSIHLIKLKKNSGACVARNVGIEAAKGKYIGFLDSDDYYYKDKIEIQVQALIDTNSDLCATSYVRINKSGNESVIDIVEHDFFNNLLYCNFITTGTLFGKKICFDNIKFDDILNRYQDWELVLRLSKKYKFCFLKNKTLCQEYQEQSITSCTSHKKTMDALVYIYNLNKEEYDSYTKAKQQIFWLIGYHSMYVKDSNNYEALWYGVHGEHFNIKRFCIFCLFKAGFKKVLEKLFIQ